MSSYSENSVNSTRKNSDSHPFKELEKLAKWFFKSNSDQDDALENNTFEIITNTDTTAELNRHVRDLGSGTFDERKMKKKSKAFSKDPRVNSKYVKETKQGRDKIMIITNNDSGQIVKSDIDDSNSSLHLSKKRLLTPKRPPYSLDKQYVSLTKRQENTDSNAATAFFQEQVAMQKKDKTKPFSKSPYYALPDHHGLPDMTKFSPDPTPKPKNNSTSKTRDHRDSWASSPVSDGGYSTTASDYGTGDSRNASRNTATRAETASEPTTAMADEERSSPQRET